MTPNISCIVVDDEPMARAILTSFIEKIPQLTLVKVCSNAMEAFEALTNQPIDLVFLDINMPEVSGLSLANSIPTNTKIIFTTAYREYAIDGFNLHAVDYLLKPIAFERFLQAIKKLFEIKTPKNTVVTASVAPTHNPFIFVRADRKMVKINFDDILYIESLSDYIKIHTHKETITTRETISNIEAKLPTASFLRIHRSYIAALTHIDSYTNEFIEISKKALPISRSYKDSILEKLKKV